MQLQVRRVCRSHNFHYWHW